MEKFSLLNGSCLQKLVSFLIALLWLGVHAYGQFIPKGMVVGVPEPTVHLVTIGINDYRHLAPWQKGMTGNFDLRLAEKDADEVGLAFMRLGDAGKFGKVLLYPLKGKQATKSGIEGLIKSLSVKSGDLLIVFFSGHGMLLEGRSYLIPQDCDPFKPALSGIEVTGFTDLIASKGATYMALFDACNSGKGTEGKKDLSNEEKIEFQQEFIKGINPPQKPGILLTSSNAFQASYEDDQIGNGVFTKAILDALSNRRICETFGHMECFVPDANGDAKVKVLEFDQYVKQAVRIRSRVMGFDQEALSLHYALGIDFPLYLVEGSGYDATLVLGELRRAMDLYLDDSEDVAFPILFRYKEEKVFSAENQRALGSCFDEGYGVPEDDVEAVKWYQKAADGGDAGGQVNLGFMYSKGKGGLTPSDVEAVKLYRKAADQGNAQGQAKLGYMYESGKGGLTPSDVEAVKLYRKAADQGNAQGQANLGYMYESGKGGLTQSDVEAVKLYRKAADQGNAQGQVNLGYMYEYGKGGLTQSDVEAVKWYRKAADQGRAGGQVNLGHMYEYGKGGLTQSDVEAVKWYRKAADQGHALGQAYLGYMYEFGKGGLTKDVYEAVRLYKLSAKQGNEYAIRQLKRLGYEIN